MAKASGRRRPRVTNYGFGACLGSVLAALLAVACGAAPGSSGSDPSNVGDGSGSADGIAGTVLPAASYAGPLALTPSAAPSLCLTAASSPPAPGDGLHLASCANTVAQQWVQKDGSLAMAGNLCLNNLGAADDAPTDASAAAGNANWRPQLRPCAAASTPAARHVELINGSVSNQAPRASFGLSAGGQPNAGSQLLWLALATGDLAQQWHVTTSAARDAGQDVDAAGVQLIWAADSNQCLDANFFAAGERSASLGLQRCQADAPSQRWRWFGQQLRGSGGCMDANGTVPFVGPCTATVNQQWGSNFGRLTAGVLPLCLHVPTSDAGQAAVVNCGLAGRWRWGQL